LVIYIRAHVPESPVWLRREHATNFWPTVWRELIVPTVMLLLAVGAFVEGYRIAAICVVILAIVLVIRLKPKYWLLFIYVILLMTAFNAMSHGTQDQYQTFLTERGLGVTQKSAIGIMYAFGAICGGVLVGHLSQKFGRRLLIVMAAICGLILIPAWVFSPTLSMLVAGGFLMQFMVQGAWGIVPVHLNELSPDAVRGTFPGFAYQLGNLFAANTAVIEARLADHYRMANGHPDYAKALAIFSAVIFLALIALAAFGPENRGKEF
jgi:SHS family lactate transporter-like MFS transporter